MKRLCSMSLKVFGVHREITCAVVFKQFDFGVSRYNFSYYCSLMMFSAIGEPKEALKRLVKTLLLDKKER